MGNKCACKCFGENNDEFMIDANYGIDDDGVTEKFQYHHTKVDTYSIKFSFFDKFYRASCAPMWLMKFSVFNKLLDDMVEEQGAMQ